MLPKKCNIVNEMAFRKIYTAENLRSDLTLLGVKKSCDLIVHVSLRSLGTVEGGYRNFLEALLQAIGPDGTLVTPSFYYAGLDPYFRKTPSQDVDIGSVLKDIKPFNEFLSFSDTGSFGDIVRLDYRGMRSIHPMKSWSAIGVRAHEFTSDVTIDNADGPESPLGRIYMRGRGQILLIGVDHVSNTSIHLSESLAGCPHYFDEVLRYKVDCNKWETFSGCGACSKGFGKVRGIIDFTKYEISGNVGNALCCLMEQKPFVDSVRDALKNSPWALLCEDPSSLVLNPV